MVTAPPGAPVPSRSTARGVLSTSLASVVGVLTATLGQPAWLAACVGFAAGVLGWWLAGRNTGSSDIGGRGSADALLHRQLAQTIIHETPDAVLFFSDSGVIRFASPAARELFFEGEDPVGHNFLKLVAQVPAPLREALLGEADHLFSVDIEGRQETYHVSRKTFTLDDELHTLLLVRYLTREISRREVDVLKRVVRLISHEVNNSLAPISSLIHSGRRLVEPQASLLGDAAPKLARVFDTIEGRAGHLKSFLEGYAKLARLPMPRPQRVNLGPFVQQLAEMMPGVTLPVPPEGEGWFDAMQLEQALLNLLKNAKESGSPLADIELRLQVEPGGATSMEVLDRGPGFSAEALKSAVLPLYTTKEHGTGMGLALSHEIVEAHGGRLTLGNRKGGGAKVSLSLPGRDVADYQATARSRLTLTRA